MAETIRGRRYRHPSKKEMGQLALKPDPLRRKSATNRITKLVGMGFSREDVVNEIMEIYGYSEGSALVMYDDTNRRLKYKTTEKMRDAVNINWSRLETLLEDAYLAGDRKTCLDAIEKMNKMANLYEQKININNGDGFTIKLDK